MNEHEHWRELGQQLRVHADAALVRRVDVVSPGLDDVVSGRGYVRQVRLAQQGEHRFDQAAHRVHRPSVGSVLLRPRVIGTEQLEGGIDEMELHEGYMLRPQPGLG